MSIMFGEKQVNSQNSANINAKPQLQDAQEHVSNIISPCGSLSDREDRETSTYEEQTKALKDGNLYHVIRRDQLAFKMRPQSPILA